MPRKALMRFSHLPYHVTARANNRETFPLPLGQVWEIMGNECLNLILVYGAEIQALVLMPNHFHMLITVPEHDLGKLMSVFMSSVTRLTNLYSGRSGHVFGGPYHWSLIESSRYFGHALKYVYRNPVRAKLFSSVESYKYSTLHGLLGSSHLPFPIYVTRAGMEVNFPYLEIQERLKWLNTPFPSEAERRIQLGLRKKLFAQIIHQEKRRPSDELEELL